MTTFTEVFTIERKDIEYDLTVEVTYNVSKYRAATVLDPEEGGQLEVETINLIEATNLTDEVVLTVTDKLAAELLACIDDESMSVACFENRDKLDEEDIGSLL